MLEISIALVVIAGLAAFLINKFLDQKQQIIDKNNSINTASSTMDELSAALDERLNTFDQRINNTWGTIGTVKEELNAIKMQNAIRNR